MSSGPTEDAILTWLVEHEHSTASQVGRASRTALPSMRGRLRRLERQKLVSGRPNDSVPSYRVYAVTDEGRLKVNR